MLIIMFSVIMRNRAVWSNSGVAGTDRASADQSGIRSDRSNDNNNDDDDGNDDDGDDDEASLTSNATYSSAVKGELQNRRRFSSSRCYTPSPKRSKEEEEDKNHSPVAKRFVLRRLSESQNIFTKSKSSHSVCKMMLFVSLVMGALGLLLLLSLLLYTNPMERLHSLSFASTNHLRSTTTTTTTQWPKPQVVVLPGPHMAETTTLQMCMSRWTGSAKTTTATESLPLLEDWMWAVPESSTFKKHNLISQGAVKNFAPLYGLLSGQRAFVFQNSKPALSQHAMKIYKEPMLAAWNSGKRIVYGSEEMDFVTSDLDSVDPDKIMDGVFDILPWNETSRPLQKQDIEVVILHKPSRIDHLLEIWQEIELDGVSFRDFVSERRDILSTANSLGLAKAFLERGVRVSILDVGGIEKEKRGNVCHAVSCEVLGVRCSSHGVNAVERSGYDISRRDFGLSSSLPGKLNLSQDEMKSIDRILNEYDCGLQASLKKYSSKIRAIYQKDLFSSCPEQSSSERPFSWVVNEISKVVHLSEGDSKDVTALVADVQPQVVLFPGPHGISSSNLQSCFSTWGSKKHEAVGNWTWAAPNAEDLPSINLRQFGAHKAFAPYFAMLSGQRSFYEDRTKDVNHEKAIDMYKAPIEEAWQSGKKLVLGSEEMDWAVSMIESMDTSKILDGVFAVLPLDNQNAARKLEVDEIIAVVPYDSNRVDHLKSIWSGTSKGAGESFRSFLRQKGNLFSTSNALGLAKAYLDRGIRTVIVDMSGVEGLGQSETNECHVVACEIMGEPCNDEKLQLKNIPTTSFLFDPRITRGPGRETELTQLSEGEIAQVEAAMKEYDCGIRDALLEYKSSMKLHILYQKELWLDCPDFSPKQRFSWMVRQIQEIVVPTTTQ